MDALGLTPDQFRHVVRSCERVLINETTAVEDLKRFLVTRLRDSCPDAAAQVAQLDAARMEALRREVVAAMQSGTGSALWG
jgi:hypothetical protein